MFIGIRLLVEDLKRIFGNKDNRLRGHLGGNTSKSAAIIRVLTQLLISSGILIVCLPIAVDAETAASTRQFASGLVGTVIGYWLK